MNTTYHSINKKLIFALLLLLQMISLKTNFLEHLKVYLIKITINIVLLLLIILKIVRHKILFLKIF
jgi:hypothetical protein